MLDCRFLGRSVIGSRTTLYLLRTAEGHWEPLIAPAVFPVLTHKQAKMHIRALSASSRKASHWH
jgi:hypothetical protein